MKKSVFIICLLLAICLILPACGSTQEEQPVALVTFISKDVSIYPNETYQLQYEVPEGKTVEFSSSDNAILTVDENGLITGIKPGTVTVIASTGEYEKAYLEVTVTKDLMPAMVNAVLNNSELQMLVGMEYDLVLTIQKAGEPVYYPAEWKSSDESVVTVVNGKLTAVAEGSAVVTVTISAEGETIERQCNVTIHPYYQVEIQQDMVKGHVGMEFTVDVKIYDGNGKLVTPNAEDLELLTSDDRIIEAKKDTFKIIGASDVAVGVRYKGNVAFVPVEIFSVTAQFFKNSAADFIGDVDGEPFSGVAITSKSYQPYFYLTDEGRQIIRDYAAANGFSKVRIHAYPILVDNMLVINGNFAANKDWTTVDIPVSDLNASFYIWSQSQGKTEIYLWFEFI